MDTGSNSIYCRILSDNGVCNCFISLVPRPCPAFHRLQYGKWREPGSFSHVSDIEDREKVEKTSLNIGGLLMCTHARSCVIISTHLCVLVGVYSGRQVHSKSMFQRRLEQSLGKGCLGIQQHLKSHSPWCTVVCLPCKRVS